MGEISTKPITVTIKETKRLTGLGRSKLYELIGDGKLKTTKVGRRRLVYFDSIERLTGQQAA